MQTKSYVSGSVNYGFSLKSRKWEFKAGNSTFLCACGGKVNADKVANILNGSLKRSKGLNLVVDNMARANIKKVLTPQVEEVE